MTQLADESRVSDNQDIGLSLRGLQDVLVNLSETMASLGFTKKIQITRQLYLRTLQCPINYCTCTRDVIPLVNLIVFH